MIESQKRIEKYVFNQKKLLGQGSYASVYQGRIIETGQPVAVKVIDKRIFSNSYNLKNLHSQIQIMKVVTHQNIVKLHDVYQTSNNMYIVTQLCDCDLFGYLKQKRKLHEEEAIKFLKQIMKGLKYLNNNNIIHRDLKPANILIKNQQCKISDFGFAKNIEQDSAFLRSIVGTPLYMSPQLLQKTKYTNKSDMWSIGLIFYQMLHGKTPWTANSEIQLINAIKTKKITYSKLISDMSKDFIARCLQINEEERISQEQAFQHQLLVGTLKRDSSARSMTKISKPQLSTLMIENNGSQLFNKNATMIYRKSDLENNSFISNNGVQKRNEEKKEKFFLTPKLNKNVSQVRLKKVEALTPKTSFININNRLKQVIALNGRQQSQSFLTKPIRIGEEEKEKLQIRQMRRRRNMTIQIDLKSIGEFAG